MKDKYEQKVKQYNEQIAKLRKKIFLTGFGMMFLIVLVVKLPIFINSRVAEAVIVEQFTDVLPLGGDWYIDHDLDFALAEFIVGDYAYYAISESNMQYEYGQGVEVIYHPDDPTSCKIYSFLELFLDAIIVCSIVSILILGIGGKVPFMIVPKPKRDYSKRMLARHA